MVGLVIIIIIIIWDELGSYHQIFFENGIKQNSKDLEIIRIGKENILTQKEVLIIGCIKAKRS